MRATAILASLLLSTAAFAAAPPQQDARGCQDHPLFTRMPTYWIHHCSAKEFDAHESENGQPVSPSVRGFKPAFA